MYHNNKILVYHGSDHVIRTPIYCGGKDENDYGNGFYTTEYEERAKSWAALNGNPSRSIVNKYELDLENLRILDLAEFGVLAWIAEVVYNRGMIQEQAEILGRRIVEMYKVDTSSYETASNIQYAEEDLRIRREVNKFMQGRMRAILMDGYTVPGVTARYAVQKKLNYHKETDYYE